MNFLKWISIPKCKIWKLCHFLDKPSRMIYTVNNKKTLYIYLYAMLTQNWLFKKCSWQSAILVTSCREGHHILLLFYGTYFSFSLLVNMFCSLFILFKTTIVEKFCSIVVFLSVCLPLFVHLSIQDFSQECLISFFWFFAWQ